MKKVELTKKEKLMLYGLAKYPQLTDADLYCLEGNENSMLRMLEYKLRKTKQEMQEIIAGL